MEWWEVLVTADVFVMGAVVGACVLLFRRRLDGAVQQGVLADEVRERRRRALDIHDNVVQGLVTTKLSLELGETEAGMASLERTLGSARDLVTELLGDGESPLDLRDGSLRRGVAAGPSGGSTA